VAAPELIRRTGEIGACKQLLSITVVPKLLSFFGLQGLSNVINIARWPILLLAASLLIAVIYRFGPSRDQPQWRWISPGSIFAAVIWIAASLLFSWYTEHFGSYNKTYGSLGAAIGFMTWMWISTTVILIGGKIKPNWNIRPEPTPGWAIRHLAGSVEREWRIRSAPGWQSSRATRSRRTALQDADLPLAGIIGLPHSHLLQICRGRRYCSRLAFGARVRNRQPKASDFFGNRARPEYCFGFLYEVPSINLLQRRLRAYSAHALIGESWRLGPCDG
jgi:hypothetical protein